MRADVGRRNLERGGTPRWGVAGGRFGKEWSVDVPDGSGDDSSGGAGGGEGREGGGGYRGEIQQGFGLQNAYSFALHHLRTCLFTLPEYLTTNIHLALTTLIMGHSHATSTCRLVHGAKSNLVCLVAILEAEYVNMCPFSALEVVWLV